MVDFFGGRHVSAEAYAKNSSKKSTHNTIKSVIEGFGEELWEFVPSWGKNQRNPVGGWEGGSLYPGNGGSNPGSYLTTHKPNKKSAKGNEGGGRESPAMENTENEATPE